MNLENYTNINIFKKTFEEKLPSNSWQVIEQPHNNLNYKNEGGVIKHEQWNPYVNNSGTTVGKYIAFFYINQVFPLCSRGRTRLLFGGSRHKNLHRVPDFVQRLLQDAQAHGPVRAHQFRHGC